jgi:hypothetical protein
VVEGRFIAEHRRKNAPPAAEEVSSGPSPRPRRVPAPPVAALADVPTDAAPTDAAPAEPAPVEPDHVDAAVAAPAETELAEVATGATEV